MKQNFPKVTYSKNDDSKNGFLAPEMLKWMLERKDQQSTKLTAEGISIRLNFANN